MITKDNLPDLLKNLGFQQRGSSYEKSIGSAKLEVNFTKGEITYPVGLTVNQTTTCNLSQNENFVVLECVHRLLEKGYKPEQIELEPTWKLGHGASGGRADILVRDNTEQPLLLIECKTAGNEFDKAWNKTLLDGDQLFSYAQQINQTRFLCLYASDFSNEILSYRNYIIQHVDDESVLAASNQFKGFKHATDVKSRHTIWRNTYGLGYKTKGIFEPGETGYLIGKSSYSINDLRKIDDAEQKKKYHEFATILRQHNVSGRENAFDKLINLFLCKLVDETDNPENLKFYWKGVAYDSHFDLLDRLQQLYKDGMGKFLGEEITYINRDQVFNAMRFIRKDLDATQRDVWELFVKQKFFTNNDFSLIDVHNAKLFYQNADVLLKIIQMWQDIRLTNPTGHNQFLGDMFEGFLDQGVKQSEGQYFTPTPICRFILMSLPLETLVKQSATPPKAIDYACGAGHFLNELALQLKPLVAQHKPAATGKMADYHKALYGIEKEYRLSKVAKVSAFMYGQQDINICHGDALVNQHNAFPEIRNHSFDLLVANPPYSVKGFLETLSETERAAYTLTDTIDKFDTNNSIETFFIERAKQLLKAGGVAAIILPSSILSNGNGTYIKTREILIQYFDIVAIAEFGSGTFGKTGTNTVTLFLRRKQTTPDTAEHYRERVSEWFASDENQPVYQDEHLIDRYAAHIGIPATDYKTLLQGEAHGPWCQADYFDDYTKAFNDSTEIKKLYTQKGFKALGEAAQNQEIDKRYLAFVHAIERDKLYHFVMASEQPNPVLIIKGPSENKAQKAFLGYDWSSAKGDEGIKLTKNAHGHHLTPLYDESNRANVEKLNRCVADNFDGKQLAIPAALSDFASTVRLVDMLDFSRTIFEKQISLSNTRRTEIQSQWPLAKVSDLVQIISGGTPDTANPAFWNGDIPWLSVTDFSSATRFVSAAEKKITPEGLKGSSTKLLNIGDLIISARGTVGALAQLKIPMAFNQSCYGLRTKTDVSNDYIFYVLKREIQQLKLQAFGSKFDAITIKTFDEAKLPIPPAVIQQQIVSECEAVDQEVSTAQTSMANALATVDQKIEAIYASTVALLEIDKVALAVQYGLSEKMNEGGVGYKIFRMNEIIGGRMFDGGAMKCADISAEEFAKYRLNRGDVLFNRTNSIEHVGKTGLFDLEGDYCFASYLVRVVPDTSKVLPLFLTLMMNSSVFQQEAKGKASKSINQANINATIMRNIKVPVPTLAVQAKVVTEVLALEQTIAEAQAVITAAPTRKQAIMQRYL